MNMGLKVESYRQMERISSSHNVPVSTGGLFKRKCSYPFNVMLTFDYNRNIRYVNAGWPGSVDDSKIWESGSAAKNPARVFLVDNINSAIQDSP